MKKTAPPPARALRLEGAGDAREYVLMVCTRGAVRSFPIEPGRSYSVGRGEKSDIVIPDDAASRAHAVIRGGDVPEFEDLGSSNGTLVAGRRLVAGESVPLEEGTTIRIASATLVVHCSVPGAEVQDEEAALPVPVDGRYALRPGLGRRGDSTSALRPGLVLSDKKMLALYRLIEDVARSNISVLILGETGTGKEVYSRLIHERSPRMTGAFVRVNCAALPETLAESELFGHERGAFTGADRPKQGLFETANNGTIFLDEVGELSLALQAKLLRALDEGEIRPVGAVKAKKVDVRLVAATNRNLRAQIASGRFRSDLFYRIAGVVANLPPLRERPDDIRALVDFFAEPCARSIGKPVPHFGSDAIAALCAYPWPGNIRELKHVVERVVLFSHSDAVTVAELQLPDEALLPPLAGSAPEGAAREFDEEGPTRMNVLSAPLARTSRGPLDGEQARIVEALERANGNQARAASLLGISRRTLINRLDEYGIPRPRKTYS